MTTSSNPSKTRELLARMRAVLRRRTGRATARFFAADTELNNRTHTLTYADANAVLPLASTPSCTL